MNIYYIEFHIKESLPVDSKIGGVYWAVPQTFGNSYAHQLSTPKLNKYYVYRW